MSFLQRTAKEYLRKYAVLARDAGIKNSLASGTCHVEAGLNTMNSGGLFLSTAEPLNDCISSSHALLSLLVKEHPVIKPRMATHNGLHYWVEISSGKRTIQIDPSPWYRCLDPGHEPTGTYSINQIEFHNSHFLSRNSDGLVFAVRAHDAGFCTVGFKIYWPRSNEAFNIPFKNGPLSTEPDYRAELLYVFSQGPFTKKHIFRTLFHVYMDLADISRMKDVSLQEQIENNAIAVGRVEHCSNIPYYSRTSLHDLEQEAVKVGLDFTSIKDDLYVLARFGTTIPLEIKVKDMPKEKFHPLLGLVPLSFNMTDHTRDEIVIARLSQWRIRHAEYDPSVLGYVARWPWEKRPHLF